jgi:hypothetical protein
MDCGGRKIDVLADFALGRQIVALQDGKDLAVETVDRPA